MQHSLISDAFSKIPNTFKSSPNFYSTKNIKIFTIAPYLPFAWLLQLSTFFQAPLYYQFIIAFANRLSSFQQPTKIIDNRLRSFAVARSRRLNCVFSRFRDYRSESEKFGWTRIFSFWERRVWIFCFWEEGTWFFVWRRIFCLRTKLVKWATNYCMLRFYQPAGLECFFGKNAFGFLLRMHTFLVGCLRGKVSWFFWTGFLKCFLLIFGVLERLWGSFIGFWSGFWI